MLGNIIASISIFVDGFANTIFDSPHRHSCIPNFVSGDFDSIRPEVRVFYENQASHFHNFDFLGTNQSDRDTRPRCYGLHKGNYGTIRKL